ncbi:MAG: monovalent cation/H+ antiporter subunit A [Sphingomonadales bacterium]
MQLALIVILPFAGAILPALFIRAGRNACATVTGLVTATALGLLLSLAPRVLAGETVRVGWNWVPALGLDVTFFLDGLGLLFAGLILGIGLLIILFARFYLARQDPMGRFFSFLLLFQGAMVGIVLSDNILLLLIFWELTSLTSFLLIGYWRHLAEGRQGARMALAVTGGGGLALIGGMLMLGHIAGSYELSVILDRRELVQASPLYLPMLVLVLLGCFTKSAQFPFHFWLPHAMAAPTPVSAYLHSATMVKAGIFLMARLWPVLAGTDAWFYLVATTGMVTMLLAAWFALFKDDLKALLAYSTVSQLGLVTMLLGFGTRMAAVVAIFHIINHACFKAALFMTAGIVDHEVGTRNTRRLGGLATLMPITTGLAVIAAASMAGVPPLNGFLSKEMMLEEASRTAWAELVWVVPALATVGALLSAAYSFRYISHVFFGPVRSDYPSKPHDPAFGMWLPPALLTALVIAIGLAPALVAGPLVAAASGAAIHAALPEFHIALWHGATPALMMSVIALGGGMLLLWRHDQAHAVWVKAPTPEAKIMFTRGMDIVVGLARRLIDFTHTGSLQRSVAMTVGAVIVLAVSSFPAGGDLLGERPMLPVTPAAVVGWGLLMAACVGVVALHRQRLLALIVVAVIGLVVSLAFLQFSAPDLALTQISVEVVTLILMLLALNLLPQQTPAEHGAARKVRDVLLAVTVGLGVGAAALAVMTRDFDTISAYHLANSYKGGGGTNVVNVILVDFRGFDTFGEIIVLGIAGLAIVALLSSVSSGLAARRLAHWVPTQARSRDYHPLMMVVATRIMLPLALLVGIYVFLRGHNEPGGGFIAGLIVSIALIMQYMASGISWAQQRMKTDFHNLVGWGVLIAGLTGIGAWMAGRPFLTSAYGYVTWPVVGTFELATAMAFDLGVFLTVIGAVMLALATLSRVERLTEHERAPRGPMDIDPSKAEAG